ncbi:E3 ubiquitin-protein ligase SH3RF3-like isoform X2 [Panicum hallii]|uniref:E3 ubiquitin-protein ligase SH3RF3-like isoform X2 n=1 Tax=Panicum hallii TaxID=206008 RepID=UPI000DF4D187|nr:E3 ubiquitin-protein ligase SH3RF3-like isoform X2 [Panicum hallii]
MAAAAASSSSEGFVGAPAALPLDKAAASGSGSGGGDRVVDCGVCAICLDKIALQETALVKGCDHAYCVTCILRWASYKQAPQCPQCKHPFEFLSVHRSLDGWSPSIRIGNRRWGDNGYIRGGRREARPVNADAAGPSRTPKKKEKAASTSGSGSGSVSKDVSGRRAKRAQKREAADKAAAEKHLKHLQRLGLVKAPAPEVPAEVGPQVNE